MLASGLSLEPFFVLGKKGAHEFLGILLQKMLI